jgi:hypothetical protein
MIKIELEFLTEDESKRELCRQYWQLGERGKFAVSVPRLAETFAVPRTKVATTVQEYCDAFSYEDPCTACGTPRVYATRSEFVERRPMIGLSRWECRTCMEAKQAAAKRAQEEADRLRFAALQSELDHHRREGLSLQTLSLRDAVYLASLLRVGGAEDLTYVMPHGAFKARLTPRDEFDRDLLDHLYTRGVICIHPGSHADSIVMDAGKFTQFVPLQVHWVLPLAVDGPSPARFLDDVESALRSRPWPEAWTAEAAELHRDLALEECLRYLDVALTEHDFEPQVGEKTLLVLRTVLRSFSIGQTFNFIWRAAKDAAAFYVRKSVAKQHAANTVPGSIQRMAERALAEGWAVKSFRRDFRTPLSQVSQTFFTGALKLPDDGFSTVPPAPVAAAATGESPPVAAGAP